MTTKIQQLDDALIVKIAAGEVVDRPVSVVKELLENAIDAHASTITIKITEGGKSSITVTDNGAGIAKEELPLAMQRHATSKISDLDDLFNIQTMGFRGEALATVDAVADVTVTSKPEAQDQAYAINNDKVLPAAHIGGTTVKVEHLFSKVPARQKYLKTPATEGRIIHDLVFKYAIQYPQIAWQLYEDGKLTLSAPASQSLLKRAKQLLAPQDAAYLVPIHSSHPSTVNIPIVGVLSLPEVKKKNRKHQIVFCNNRLIQSSTVTAAIDKAYQGRIPSQIYPIVVLNISIDPKQVDVNVHPAKTTVKFTQDGEVFRSVYHAVLDTLDKHAHMQQPGQSTAQVRLSPKPDDTTITEDNISPAKVADAIKQYGVQSTKQSEITQNIEQPVSQPQTVAQENTHENIPNFIVHGVVNKTYVVAEFDEGLTLTDFHAAYERLNYEIFKKQYNAGSLKTQELLEPYIYESDSKTIRTLLEQKQDMEKIGVVYDEFGPNTIQITRMPFVLGRLVQPSVIEEIADSVSDKNKALDVYAEKRLAMMACKASPRAGDTISNAEATQLIKDLFEHQLSWTCPHGRPVMLLLSLEKLGKMFERH